jgi:hypothetical protein
MLPALVLLTMAVPPLADCVPARWDSADVKTLRFLEKTPVNCLLLEPAYWEREFVEAARAQGLRVLAVVATAGAAERAAALEFNGLVVEGALEVEAGGRPVVRIQPRGELDFGRPSPVMGTAQGLWPGIHSEEKGGVVSLPTSAPWVVTNGGFLRYVQAAMPPETRFWLAMRPPEGEVVRARGSIRALAEAAMSGARWVLALDAGFREGLFAGDGRPGLEWMEVMEHLRFLERTREFGTWPDRSGLVLVQDAESGALYSGGFADMLGARHVPLRIAPARGVARAARPATEVLLNVSPPSLTAEEKALLLGLAKKGLTVLNAPFDWSGGRPKEGVFVFPEEEVKGLSDAWREINNMVGRRNFGLRVFGAPGMISTLKTSPDGRQRAVHLLNYTDYPVQNISLHVSGEFTRARILTPGGEKAAEVYQGEDGIEIEIEKVDQMAIVVIE